MITTWRSALLALVLALVLPACADPNTEAALLAALDGEDVAGLLDGDGDVPDVNLDGLDGVDIQLDTADVAGSDTAKGDADAADAADSVDAADAADAGDAEDVADAPDTADIGPDTVDAVDAADILDSVDAADADPEVIDITEDAQDSGPDSADVPDTADVPDVPDVPVDLCAGVTCTDKLPCLTGVCVPQTGLCAYTNAAANTPCDDTNACTNNACLSGACVITSTISCNDANVCTDDACEPASGCTHLPNTVTCTDANPCTQGDTCGGSVCLPGAVSSCNDGNVCTTDACKPVDGACDHTATGGTGCSDGDACTDSDACDGNTCKGGTSITCDDTDPCTVDSCAPLTGCKHTPADPGTPCGGTNFYCNLQNNCEHSICGDGVIQKYLGETCDDANDQPGDGCDPDCHKEQTCGNGKCDDVETFFSCQDDCGFLGNRYGAACTTHGYKDTCNAGYACVARSVGQGGNICVADLATWPPIGVSHPASDFVPAGGGVLDLRTGLVWATQILGPKNWADAQSECAISTEGGMSDWRPPTRAELLSLTDLTVGTAPASAAPGLTWPTDGNYRFWTAQHSAGTIALNVNFLAGNNDGYFDTSPAYMRCVRTWKTPTPATGNGQRYELETGGKTVLDRLTGLHWAQAPGTDITWAAAINHCTTNADSLPETGWRLPTRHELETLVDVYQGTGTLDPIFAAGIGDQYWSSSQAAMTTNNAWSLFFIYGNTYYKDFSFAYNARCVRDCDGDCSAVCGDGVCSGSETVVSCAADCGFLINANLGPCSSGDPPSPCADGYVCVDVAGGNACVADFDAWLPFAATPSAADFTSMSLDRFADTRTGLEWTKNEVFSAFNGNLGADCAELTVDGLAGWHLPTLAQLASLLALNAGGTPKSFAPLLISLDHFKSASVLVGDATQSWRVALETGALETMKSCSFCGSLCVRETQTTVQTGVGLRFALQDNGQTVLDRTTGLHWQQGITAAYMDWSAAQSHCTTLGNSLPGTGWRLPTATELRGLVNRGKAGNVVDGVFSSPPYDLYWTQTAQGNEAWTVSMYTGISGLTAVGGIQTARCVR